MTSDDLTKKLHTDEDFINLKRFEYSLRELLKRYPDGVPDRLIALALNLSEEDVETIYNDIVARIREKIE